jgi:hypothetical protein
LSLARKASELSERLKSKKYVRTENQPLISKPIREVVASPMVRQVVSQKLDRRDFLKLSALTTSGSLAGIVLPRYVDPAGFVDALLNQLNPANSMVMINPVDPSAYTLDPLTTPKFENHLTSPPRVYQPTVITNSGLQPKEKNKQTPTKVMSKTTLKAAKMFPLRSSNNKGN